MHYPTLLIPNDTEVISLPSGIEVAIPKTQPLFASLSGEQINDNYGNKAVLNFNNEPAFAELVILRAFLNDGWQGVWVDTFRRKFRTSCNPLNAVTLPPKQQDFLDGIIERAGSRNGCWDVFCWKEDTRIFAESKRYKRDRIRDTQRKWLQASLDVGLSNTSFLVVEWSIKSTKM